MSHADFVFFESAVEQQRAARYGLPITTTSGDHITLQQRFGPFMYTL